MEYREFKPSESLSGYINCFWMIKGDLTEGPAAQGERIIPDGSLEIIFHLGKRMVRKNLDGKIIKEGGHIVLGQVTKPYFIHPTGKVYMIGVRFFPSTAHLFFDLPVSRLNDKSVDLEDVWGPQFYCLRSKLQDCRETGEAIKMIEAFLVKRISASTLSNSDQYLIYSSNQILANKGQYPIGDLSRELGISNRYLQKIFYLKAGVSPKFFAKIIRFQNVFNALQKHRTLTEAGYEAGYFDQAHFIKDFKLFTGTTPTTYFKELHPMGKHFMNPQHSSYLYNFR